MKRIIFILSICLTVWQSAFGQNFKGKSERLEISPPSPKLKVGEVLQYSVEWLGMSVGNVVLNVKEIAQVNGNDCYHITAHAEPNKFLKNFVDLEYNVDSYLDVKLLSSRRFEKRRRLDDNYNQTTIDFDLKNGRAFFKSQGSQKSYRISEKRGQIEAKKTVTGQISKDTQDLLSSLYYFRLIDLKEAKSYTEEIYYAQRSWKIEFKVQKPFIRDIRKKGSFVVFNVSPASELNDLILGKRKFSISFTADSRRIPVEFKFSTGIGSIRASIKEIPK